MDEFYITLPSNANLDFFPHNKPSHFVTKLSPPLTLTGAWEVALTEIILPRSWYNITNANNKYSLQTDEEILEEINLPNKEYLIPLTPIDGIKHNTIIDDINYNITKLTNYEPSIFVLNENNSITVNIPDKFEIHVTVQYGSKMLYMIHLPEEDRTLNTGENFFFRVSTQIERQFFTILEKFRKSKVKHNVKKISLKSIPIGLYSTIVDIFKQFESISLHIQPDRKATLTIPNEIDKLIFEDGLKDFLGFKNTDYPSGVHISTYPVELNAGITELFIYTDIIEFHHVGNIKAPLLKVVQVASEKGEQVVKLYATPPIHTFTQDKYRYNRNNN